MRYMAGAVNCRERSGGGNGHQGSRAATRKDGRPPAADLVMRAREGDRLAWDGLVERYAPLIWSICRRYGMDGADAEDVAQAVWLNLVNHLANLRDPAALPGWLVTTTRRECHRVLRAARLPLTAGLALNTEDIPDPYAAEADQDLLAAERNAALREAFRDLPPADQRLLGLLMADPPVPYAEISAILGIKLGSIGPTRSRCLDRLRRHPAIAALVSDQMAAGAAGRH